jgi:hypothetical protein
MHRTRAGAGVGAAGIEPGKGPNYQRPVTSGLQILSRLRQRWSARAEAGWCGSQLQPRGLRRSTVVSLI